MARFHGFGVPGNAAMSNAEEMPSEIISSSREPPKPGPARIRTLWSISWENVRGSQSCMIAEAGLRRLPERDGDASGFRIGKTVGAGLGDDLGAAAGIGHGDGRRGSGQQ